MVVVFKDNFFAPPKFRDEFYDFLKKILLFYFSLLYKIPSYPKSVRIICLSCVTLWFFGLLFWISNRFLIIFRSNVTSIMFLSYLLVPKGWQSKLKKNKKSPHFILIFLWVRLQKNCFTLHLSFLHLKFLTPFTLLQKHTQSHNHQTFLHQEKKSICKKKPFWPIFLLIF